MIEKERSAFVNHINVFYRGGSTPPTEAVYTLTRKKVTGSCTVYILSDINRSDNISNEWYMQMEQPDYTPTDENMDWVKATAKNVLMIDSATNNGEYSSKAVTKKYRLYETFYHHDCHIIDSRRHIYIM